MAKAWNGTGELPKSIKTRWAVIRPGDIGAMPTRLQRDARKRKPFLVFQPGGVYRNDTWALVDTGTGGYHWKLDVASLIFTRHSYENIEPHEEAA